MLLVSGGFFPDNLLLARQLREQQVRLRAFIGPWGVAYAKFINELQGCQRGFDGDVRLESRHHSTWDRGRLRGFCQKISEKFGQSPNTTTMHGYTAARALLAAIAQVLKIDEPLNGIAISHELRKLDLVLPMEHLRFQENGDPVDYRQVIVQIQDKEV